MRWPVALLAVTACVDLERLDATWEPAGATAGALATEVGPDPAPRAAPAGPLRVASWNMLTAADPEAMAAEIATSSALATADVILVQEIEAYPDEPGTRASRLAAALGMTWFYAPARPEDDGTHGDAILSRYPLVDARVMRLPRVEQTIRTRERIAVGATVLVGDQALALVTVHLDTRIGPVDRIRQLDPAVRDLPELALVGGDFNALPWSFVGGIVPLTGTQAIVGNDQGVVLDDYMAAFDFASGIPVDESTHTSFFHLAIDRMYLRGATILDGGVARDVAGSDHWAVWVDVGL